jgi:hypothetical protein
VSNIELAQGYEQRINEIHATGQRLAGEIKFASLAFINNTRAGGLLLEDAKNALGHAGWRELQLNLDFGKQRDRVIQTYLTFARKNPDEITDLASGMASLSDCMMVTGLLPFPDGHGPQQLHAPNVFSWAAKQAMSFRAELKKKLAQTPLESFTRDARDQFVETLRPMRDDLDALIARAQSI